MTRTVPSPAPSINNTELQEARDRWDYILVGGGLQNGLIALALLHQNPHCRILMVEKATTLGGNHTWSFHESDVGTSAWPWFEPLVTYRWPRYEVRFRDRRRVVQLPYASIASQHFHRVVTSRMVESGGLILHGKVVEQLTDRDVTLDDGTIIAGKWVIDSRGPSLPATSRGYQKFVGVELEVSPPFDPNVPLVMDATVPQYDGFRFLYILPFTPTRCIVEDTYFSDTPDLDVDLLTDRIKEYVHEEGHRIDRIIRQEQGVLPMPWKGTVPRNPASSAALVAGYAAGLFHPATCYSLPCAVRLAQHIAQVDPASGETGNARWRETWPRFLAAHRRQVRFAERLNWLLFRCFEPEMRWHVFSRFYSFPESMISRFFALRMTIWDQCRLLGGRPPRGFSMKRFFGAAR